MRPGDEITKPKQAKNPYPEGRTGDPFFYSPGDSQDRKFFKRFKTINFKSCVTSTQWLIHGFCCTQERGRSCRARLDRMATPSTLLQ
jgi:hypothetical protein